MAEELGRTRDRVKSGEMSLNDAYPYAQALLSQAYLVAVNCGAMNPAVPGQRDWVEAFWAIDSGDNGPGGEGGGGGDYVVPGVG